MKYFAAILVSIFAFGWESLFAITPVDVQLDPKPGWGGKVVASFAGKSGNNQKDEYDLGLLTRHRRDNRIWLLIADYRYGESGDIEDEDEGSLHSRWIKQDLLAPRWDLEFFAQWEYDEFKDLSKRRLAGTGTRWRFSLGNRAEVTNGLLGVGLFYEDEESRSNFDDESGVRINTYGKAIWDRSEAQYPFKLYGMVYVQPKLNSPEDIRALAVTSIEFRVLQKISLAFTLQWEYDSEPFPGVKKNDYEYQTQLSYHFD